MEEKIYKVYVKLDTNNVIIDLLSDIESNITGISVQGWTQIDEGQGDTYSHAQSNYFTIDGKKPLKDDSGKYNYKLVDNKPVELTDEEKESLFPAPTPQPTLEEKNRADIDYIMLMQGL